MHSNMWTEIPAKQRTWHQEHDCISYLRGKSGQAVEPVLKGTLSDSIFPHHYTGSMSNSLIQVRASQINSNRTHAAQSDATRKTPATYAKTGLTALFIFPKLARPSSSLKQFSASTAGFSSLSAAEGEGGGPMRLRKKEKWRQTKQCKTSDTSSNS